VHWRKLSTVENECTSHNSIVLAIFCYGLLKLVETWQSYDEILLVCLRVTRCTGIYSLSLTNNHSVSVSIPFCKDFRCFRKIVIRSWWHITRNRCDEYALGTQFVAANDVNRLTFLLMTNYRINRQIAPALQVKGSACVRVCFVTAGMEASVQTYSGGGTIPAAACFDRSPSGASTPVTSAYESSVTGSGSQPVVDAAAPLQPHGDSPRVRHSNAADKTTTATTSEAVADIPTTPQHQSVDSAGERAMDLHPASPPTSPAIAPSVSAVPSPSPRAAQSEICSLPHSPPVVTDVTLTPSSKIVVPPPPPPTQVKSAEVEPCTPASSVPSTPTTPCDAPKKAACPAKQRDVSDSVLRSPAVKAAPACVTPVVTDSIPAKRCPPPPTPSKVPAVYQQASASTTSSVTPTASMSTMQSEATTPRPTAFYPADQHLHAALAVDDVATSSSFGSIKSPAPSTGTGSYLRSHQQRRAAATNTSMQPAGTGVPPCYYHHHHAHDQRKSRSVSPTSQSDSYRSSTPPSTMQSNSTLRDESRGRSPSQHSGLSPDRSSSSVDWDIAGTTASDVSNARAYRLRAYSPRHVTEYRHCVSSEPEDVRPSRRLRENTHNKLFGATEPDSPRTAAVASAAAAGGLTPTSASFSARRNAEDTQATLFGPPDPHRKSSRVHPDTHQSLFGPPPVLGPHVQRRSRSCFHDTVDLLRHDPTAGGHSDESLRAVRGRYELRHQDTSAKLFGDAFPPPMHYASAGPRQPYPDHDIFLVGAGHAQPAATPTSTL